MDQILVGSVTLAVGCLLFIRRKEFVDEIVRLNNAGMGFYKYGKWEKNYGLWFTIFFSIICVTLGFLTIFGIFKLK